MTQIAGGGGHVLCVTMTQWLGKSICDSPLVELSRTDLPHQLARLTLPTNAYVADKSNWYVARKCMRHQQVTK